MKLITTKKKRKISRMQEKKPQTYPEIVAVEDAKSQNIAILIFIAVFDVNLVVPVRLQRRINH
jgi:hypothetical protein